MARETDNVQKNIPHIQNIMHNIVGPTHTHCYGSE